MRSHLLPITLCSSIIFKQGQVRNIDEVLLNIERSADDKLFVNGTQIITRDIITTNGVVHILDGVLISENGIFFVWIFGCIGTYSCSSHISWKYIQIPDKPLLAALERAKLTSFLDLLSQVGMKSLLDEIKNVTIFAPSNKALESLPDEVRSNPSVSVLILRI